jgi:arginyl-tRNA synthetase
LLRADGTSVYMTQDLGTADMRFDDFPMDESIYVVANEQDYHFKVLKLIMQKLGRTYADGIYHLSYGMVDLPEGRMKSREGTVVDADDLIAEMTKTAASRTMEQGKIDSFSEEEAQALYHDLAIGALKYYLLKVEPKKRMVFQPDKSVDFQGDTGVYIQYNHAKIRSLLRKAKDQNLVDQPKDKSIELQPVEEELAFLILQYPEKVAEAAANYAPSVIANYIFALAKTYSKMYVELPVIPESNTDNRAFRLQLSEMAARNIASGLSLLGVNAPERM